jgi:hypothetical protein
MGYRSDVKYVLLFKTDEKRQAFKIEAMLIAADVDDGLDVINNDWEYKIDLHDADFPYQIRLHYEDVKWYESIPWVSLQEKLMDLAATDDYEGAFVFLRLGEETDDVETECNAAGEIHIYADNYIEVIRKSEFA